MVPAKVALYVESWRTKARHNRRRWRATPHIESRPDSAKNGELPIFRRAWSSWGFSRVIFRAGALVPRSQRTDTNPH